MILKDTYKIVLGSAQSPSTSNTNLTLGVDLEQQFRQDAEFERVQDISQAEVFLNERQSSNIFRPSTKLTFILDNSYIGETNYSQFRNNLYYVNSFQSAVETCLSPNLNTILWSGYPQYFEFDLIRTDSDVIGYTIPSIQNNITTPPHVNFDYPKAAEYNWNFHLSYPFENDTTKVLSCKNLFYPTISHTWVSGDGIPFVIKNGTINGHDVVFFYCPMQHGLSLGEYVELSFSYDNENLFLIDFLGDGTYNSDLYVFAIINVGFLGSVFADDVTGTFKRVLDPDKLDDTRSSYYIRRHKILTNSEDAVVTNAGFEQNPFPTTKQYEYPDLTPNKIGRFSIKEGNQSYILSFNKDVSTENLFDNHNRPVTELFFTNIWIGRFGWTMKPVFNNIGLRQGYGFNIGLENNLPNSWWDSTPNTLNISSLTNIQLQSFTNGNETFYYNQSLIEGDTLDGALCEWNNHQLIEREINQIYHKIVFNDNVFNINIGEYVGLNNNQFGYYYEPFNKIKIKDFSSYIEEADIKEVDGIPSYAFYSENTTSFRWRDIYTYGFIDDVGSGVNYPFLNGAHYPYETTIFRLIPEGSNENSFINIIQDPITDECE